MSVDTELADPVWEVAWSRALDDLELDLHATEQMLADLHADAEAALEARTATWTPPTGLGPLPVSLQDRGRALLERQLAAARAITTQLAANRRHVAAAEAMSARNESRPLFVDQAL
jgi:hypothetical protein